MRLLHVLIRSQVILVTRNGAEDVAKLSHKLDVVVISPALQSVVLVNEERLEDIVVQPEEARLLLVRGDAIKLALSVLRHLIIWVNELLTSRQGTLGPGG